MGFVSTRVRHLRCLNSALLVTSQESPYHLQYNVSHFPRLLKPTDLKQPAEFSKLVTVKTWVQTQICDSKDISTCFNPRAVQMVEMSTSIQHLLLLLDINKTPSVNIR